MSILYQYKINEFIFFSQKTASFILQMMIRRQYPHQHFAQASPPKAWILAATSLNFALFR